MVVGTCHLHPSRDGGRDLPSSGEVVPTMEQVPCEFWADRPNFIFSQQHLTWFGTFYSGQHCFKGVLGMDLLSSGDVALTMGQVPCEFWGDRPNFIFQLAAPDMIWHIYSSQHCFKGVLGMDLLSSGDVAPNMGQVACEFQADQPIFIFQPAAPDVIWHIYSHLYYSLREGGRNLPSSREEALTMGKVPVSFEQISLGSVFQGKCWDKGPSSLALPKMVHHP